MTAADLDRIESSLGFALPAFYRRFMRTYPPLLHTFQPEWLKPVEQWEFANDPDRVIAFNRFVRAQEEGYFVEDGFWPDEYLVIGSEYDQNYFVINRLDGDEMVYRWGHDEGEFEPLAHSLKGYADWLIAWWDEIKRDQG